MPASRRLSDRLRGLARRLRGVAAAERSAGFSYPLDGRVDRSPTGRNAACPHACAGDADKRLGARGGEVVQPAARLWLPDAGGGHGRYLRAHGDAAALWTDRASAGPDRAGAFRSRTQRDDGRGSPTRRPAGALTNHQSLAFWIGLGGLLALGEACIEPAD